MRLQIGNKILIQVDRWLDGQMWHVFLFRVGCVRPTILGAALRCLSALPHILWLDLKDAIRMFRRRS